MKALVLEKPNELRLRDIQIDETLGPDDVRIALKRVGICGSDVHYWLHGRIGGFVVTGPMILGHEAAGMVIETGRNVTGLKPGDRVCMEPGIPDPNSRISRLGRYNLDPSMTFWATPPDHGVTRETVVHPANYTFKLPDHVSYEEGAMVEPLAVGLHAATRAGIRPGDTALVVGAGTIGMMAALAALSGGCSRVFIADVKQPKLDLIGRVANVVPVNVEKQDLKKTVMEQTDGWGADIVFEATGSESAYPGLFEPLCPGGTVVLIGSPPGAVPFAVSGAQVKEADIRTIFRYAHMYPRAVELLRSGRIDLKPFITDRYAFADAVKAYEYARQMSPASVKIMIEL